MNIEEFCDKLRSLRDKNCMVFVSRCPKDAEIERQRRHRLWVKDEIIKCEELALAISWVSLKVKSYKDEVEIIEEENSVVLRIDNLKYRITVFVPAKLEDI